jgi:hypothetical protein
MKKLIAKPVKLGNTKMKKVGHCVCRVCPQNIKMKHNQHNVRNVLHKRSEMRRSCPNVINVASAKRPRKVPRLVRHVLRVSMVPIVSNVMLVCIGKMNQVPVLQFANRVHSDTIKMRKAVPCVLNAHQENINHKKVQDHAKIATKVTI